MQQSMSKTRKHQELKIRIFYFCTSGFLGLYMRACLKIWI